MAARYITLLFMACTNVALFVTYTLVGNAIPLVFYMLGVLSLLVTPWLASELMRKNALTHWGHLRAGSASGSAARDQSLIRCFYAPLVEAPVRSRGDALRHNLRVLEAMMQVAHHEDRALLERVRHEMQGLLDSGAYVSLSGEGMTRQWWKAIRSAAARCAVRETDDSGAHAYFQ